MSYRDPYPGHYAAGSSGQHQPQYYTEPVQGYTPYPSQQTYSNTGAESYNPYITHSQGYGEGRRFEQGQPNYESYGDNDMEPENYNDYPPVTRQQTHRSTLSRKSKQPSVSVVPVRKEESGFEAGEFTPTPLGQPRRTLSRKKRTPRALREYRYDHQGNLWMKGGRGRCAARVCCCSLMTTVFLIVSIVLALALWIRPPSIYIGNVQTMTENGSAIQPSSDGVQVNLGVNISVSNPNYFSVDFKKIEAQIFYPPQNIPVGGGQANNIVFKSNSQTNFTFPFSLQYNSTADPGGAIITDLAKKCGVLGGTKTNIDVNYSITLGIRILLVTISPVISNQFSFPCPLQPSDISVCSRRLSLCIY
ncbi:hypothetical protein CVT26_002734 [Gymnopilus dilepis]|uniref:Late embryogenesis abundant protein LEA-2 subgroup domain-containing protein n=1 Tax=Gymnopilus dilepis TaxID=231916 RepID=A0A409VC55_9AGAR|nr:hypothetical protein CVT26_002734 [Gymnopilus dilepis]